MALQLNGNGSLSGTDISLNGITFDQSGIITEPSNPAWFVRRSNHVTATGNILFDAVIHDNASGYNVSNGRYTAPKTGKYLVCFSTLLYTMGTSSAAYLHVNGANYGNISAFGTYGQFSGTYAGQGASHVIHMNANDYVTIYFAHAGTNLHSGYTFWSGVFLG